MHASLNVANMKNIFWVYQRQNNVIPTSCSFFFIGMHIILLCFSTVKDSSLLQVLIKQKASLSNRFLCVLNGSSDV